MGSRILLASLCSLALAAACPASASDRPPTALLQKPERLVLFAIGGPAQSNDAFPAMAVHFDLVDQNQQSRGTVDVVGVATRPRAQPQGDPDPPGLITFVATLSDGSIVGEGLFGFDDDQPFTVAVVGGTGRYRKARGQVRVAPQENDRARIVFHLIP